MDSKITIDRQDYFQLRVDSEKLMLLENGGLDNWDWYYDSLYPEDGDDTIEIIKEKLKQEIFGE